MNFMTCRALCIARAIAEGRKDHAALYRKYPVPKPETWEACLSHLAHWNESKEDPFECMGRYEIHLRRSGRRTVLDEMAEHFIQECKRLRIYKATKFHRADLGSFLLLFYLRQTGPSARPYLSTSSLMEAIRG